MGGSLGKDGLEQVLIMAIQAEQGKGHLHSHFTNEGTVTEGKCLAQVHRAEKFSTRI